MNKVAFTDFDGTLSKGYISMDFMDFLYYERLYAPKQYQEQQNALLAYKNNIISYDEWCRQWGELWALGLKGHDTTLIASAAEDFFIGFKKNIYPTSYDIVNFLKINHDVKMLSVGAYEVASLAAKELGIDEVIATTLDYDIIGATETTRNIGIGNKKRYNGKIHNPMHIPESKELFIKSLGYTPHVGLGDSIGDTGFLKLVDVPIVMNPSGAMQKYARDNNWPCLNSEFDKKLLINSIANEIIPIDYLKITSKKSKLI